MFCINCGKPVGTNDKFCKSCGASSNGAAVNVGTATEVPRQIGQATNQSAQSFSDQFKAAKLWQKIFIIILFTGAAAGGISFVYDSFIEPSQLNAQGELSDVAEKPIEILKKNINQLEKIDTTFALFDAGNNKKMANLEISNGFMTYWTDAYPDQKESGMAVSYSGRDRNCYGIETKKYDVTMRKTICIAVKQISEVGETYDGASEYTFKADIGDIFSVSQAKDSYRKPVYYRIK